MPFGNSRWLGSRDPSGAQRSRRHELGTSRWVGGEPNAEPGGSFAPKYSRGTNSQGSAGKTLSPRQRLEPAFRITPCTRRPALCTSRSDIALRRASASLRSGASAGSRRRSGRRRCYGCSFALKNATTAELNSRWKAARSNPAGSRQPSGATLANAGVQGARNAKWLAFGTT